MREMCAEGAGKQGEKGRVEFENPPTRLLFGQLESASTTLRAEGACGGEAGGNGEKRRGSAALQNLADIDAPRQWPARTPGRATLPRSRWGGAEHCGSAGASPCHAQHDGRPPRARAFWSAPLPRRFPGHGQASELEVLPISGDSRAPPKAGRRLGAPKCWRRGFRSALRSARCGRSMSCSLRRPDRLRSALRTPARFVCSPAFRLSGGR